MRPHDEATANLLGAFSSAVTDQARLRVSAACGQSESGAATLTALQQFLDHPSLDRIRQVLGLTPSGAVRLVDRLADEGLVARGPGADGRTRSVRLTAKGRRAAVRVSSARAAYLGELVTTLSAAERRTLHALLSTMMSRVVDAKDGGAWICRLCDLQACGRAEGRCPTASAAAAKYASE